MKVTTSTQNSLVLSFSLLSKMVDAGFIAPLFNLHLAMKSQAPSKDMAELDETKDIDSELFTKLLSELDPNASAGNVDINALESFTLLSKNTSPTDAEVILQLTALIYVALTEWPYEESFTEETALTTKIESNGEEQTQSAHLTNDSDKQFKSSMTLPNFSVESTGSEHHTAAVYLEETTSSNGNSTFTSSIQETTTTTSYSSSTNIESFKKLQHQFSIENLEGTSKSDDELIGNNELSRDSIINLIQEEFERLNEQYKDSDTPLIKCLPPLQYAWSCIIQDIDTPSQNLSENVVREVIMVMDNIALAATRERIHDGGGEDYTQYFMLCGKKEPLDSEAEERLEICRKAVQDVETLKENAFKLEFETVQDIACWIPAIAKHRRQLDDQFWKEFEEKSAPLASDASVDMLMAYCKWLKTDQAEEYTAYQFQKLTQRYGLQIEN